MKSAVIDVCLHSSFPLYWAEWCKLCATMNNSRRGDTGATLMLWGWRHTGTCGRIRIPGRQRSRNAPYSTKAPGKHETPQDSCAAVWCYLVRRAGMRYPAWKDVRPEQGISSPWGLCEYASKEQQKNPKRALKQSESLCSACVGRLPSFSQPVYCSGPAWPYSPRPAQTARPSLFAFAPEDEMLRGAVGWSGRFPPVPGLRAACSSPRGTILQSPAPVLALG